MRPKGSKNKSKLMAVTVSQIIDAFRPDTLIKISAEYEPFFTKQLKENMPDLKPALDIKPF